jgi:hypothetical protein
LQLYLDELFDHKSYYQSFLLRFFHVDKDLIDVYQEKTKEVDIVENNTSIPSELPLHFDKNCIYLSIQIYKALWMEDHYLFYMKVSIKENSETAFPMRRYSVEF